MFFILTEKLIIHYFKLIVLWLCLILPIYLGAMPINVPAPPLQGERISDQSTIRLQDYLGKVVLIDFWASWCVPCRRALPELNKLQKKYKNKSFTVLAINLDKNSEDAQHFLKQYPVQYPILINVPAPQINAYQIEGLPVSYLIDKQGKIIERFIGFKHSHVQKIEDFLLPL